MSRMTIDNIITNLVLRDYLIYDQREILVYLCKYANWRITIHIYCCINIINLYHDN